MAQRNSPSRRIPGEPLAGILRTVAYQARYSNRRRTNVATVTNSVAAAESAEAAAATGVASLAAPATMAEALAMTATPPELETQQVSGGATRVATEDGMPGNAAATLTVNENGSATWQYEDHGTLPHVVASVVADQPAVATIDDRTATAATVRVWDLTGQPVPGALVSVIAHWP